MAFITPEVQALITKGIKEGGDAAKLAEALKAAEDRIAAVEAVNEDQKADLEAIAKAVQDGALTATETTETISEVLEVEPVNAPVE
jgi:hypothetical protein